MFPHPVLRLRGGDGRCAVGLRLGAANVGEGGIGAWKLSGDVLVWGWLRAKGPDDSGEELDQVRKQCPITSRNPKAPGSQNRGVDGFFFHATVSQGWREGTLIPHGTIKGSNQQSGQMHRSSGKAAQAD